MIVYLAVDTSELLTFTCNRVVFLVWMSAVYSLSPCVGLRPLTHVNLFVFNHLPHLSWQLFLQSAGKVWADGKLYPSEREKFAHDVFILYL